MKLITVAAILAVATPVFLQPQYTLWYDTLYDQKGEPLTSVACSTYLISYGLNTFGDLTTYPYIGGAPPIEGWDSPACGSCWGFSYTDPSGTTRTLTFTAINTADNESGGFTMSLDGMNFLMNDLAPSLDGRIQITVTQEDRSLCGL